MCHCLESVPPAASTPFGDPEEAVERGAKKGGKAIEDWVDLALDAVSGLTEPGPIQRALATAGEQMDITTLGNSLTQEAIRSIMLGASDADWEAVNSSIVEPAKFMRAPLVCKSGVNANYTQKPFDKAVADFVTKKVVSYDKFLKLTAAEKRKAFSAAGSARRSVLQDMFDELSISLRDGEDLRQFRKRLKDSMSASGWLKPGPRREVPTIPARPWHVETIYRNNVMGSYARGRVEQMSDPAVTAVRPYWQIVTLQDPNTRPTHRAVHGKVLRWDDEFWQRAPLPWGHNCRCRAVTRSAVDVERSGLIVVDGFTLQSLPDMGWAA